MLTLTCYAGKVWVPESVLVWAPQLHGYLGFYTIVSGAHPDYTMSLNLHEQNKQE